MLKTLSFGAVIWDIIEGKQFLGGDSLNVAAHFSKLGGESYYLTCLGCDDFGNAAQTRIEELGISTKYIQRDGEHQTGYSKVEFNEAKIPAYTFAQDASDGYIKIRDDIIVSIKEQCFDVFWYSSYCLFNPVSRITLYNILDAVDFPIKFCDINIRRNYHEKSMLEKCFRSADILKLNEDEMRCVSNELYGKEIDEMDFFSRVQKTYDFRAICLTKGNKGCVVYLPDKGDVSLPPYPVYVVDTVGAGDAFSAAFLVKYHQTNNCVESAKYGNILGGYVTSMNGGIPEYSIAIKEMFDCA
jgi:fructokinase